MADDCNLGTPAHLTKTTLPLRPSRFIPGPGSELCNPVLYHPCLTSSLLGFRHSPLYSAQGFWFLHAKHDQCFSYYLVSQSCKLMKPFTTVEYIFSWTYPKPLCLKRHIPEESAVSNWQSMVPQMSLFTAMHLDRGLTSLWPTVQGKDGNYQSNYLPF